MGCPFYTHMAGRQKQEILGGLRGAFETSPKYTQGIAETFPVNPASDSLTRTGFVQYLSGEIPARSG
jgi:hypothetical protein